MGQEGEEYKMSIPSECTYQISIKQQYNYTFHCWDKYDTILEKIPDIYVVYLRMIDN